MESDKRRTKEQLISELQEIRRRIADLESSESKRKRAEDILHENQKKLKDSEIRYRRLFETAQDGILILDANSGEINDVNPFLIDMLGYTKQEFIGKKLWELGFFSDTKASRRAFDLLQNQGYMRYENLPLKTKEEKSAK